MKWWKMYSWANLSLICACCGSLSTCHRNLPLAMRAVFWWDSFPARTIFLKMGCPLTYTFICTGYVESVCTCLWFTDGQEVNGSNSEIVVLVAQSAPDMPASNPNQVPGFMVQNKNPTVPILQTDLMRRPAGLDRSRLFRNPSWQSWGHQHH